MGTALNENLIKYPRTPHLQGSRLQEGDDGSDQAPYHTLEGQYIVIEEKMDGANSGFSFNDAGEMRLQSHGHYLTGGGRESQFGLFKSWASQFEGLFLERFEDRYVVFGEWMFEKHTIYYDNLPHLFLEFDIWDKKNKLFLSTAMRRELCAGLPIKSVPVLYEGIAPKNYKEVLKLVTQSTAKTTDWEQYIQAAAQAGNMDFARVKKQTLWHNGMEGLYVKVETPTQTIGRYKWVRSDFLQTILDSDSHHQHRMLLPNKLDPLVNIFADPRWSSEGMSL